MQNLFTENISSVFVNYDISVQIVLFSVDKGGSENKKCGLSNYNLTSLLYFVSLCAVNLRF